MSGVISLPFLSIHSKIWTWGKPLFWNSIEYKIVIAGPNIVADHKSCRSSCSFIWNTRTITSGRSFGFSP